MSSANTSASAAAPSPEAGRPVVLLPDAVPPTGLAAYRAVLGLPGVLRLVVLATLARIPQTMAGVVLTLHVARTLGAGYAVAGAVVATCTVGMTVGGPWRGRVVDRSGVRRALVPSILVGGGVWLASPWLDAWGLAVAGFAAGVLALPIFTVTRQSLAVLVPEDRHRVVYSLDSIGTEISFMVGPALGVLVATQWSSRTALVLVGLTTVLAGLTFWVLDPPTRSADVDPAVAPDVAGDPVHPGGGDPVRLNRRDWFTPSLAVVFAVSGAATIVLSATDVSIVAVLDEAGQVGFAGLVAALWGLGSLVGVAVYGALHRPVPPMWLLFALAVLTLPAALAHSVAALSAALFVAGALCAPTIAATTEAVARLVPEQARGEAMGWHGSALTVGAAAGAPLAGAMIDGVGASAGFLAAGGAGALIAGAGLVLGGLRGWRRRALREPGTGAVPQPRVDDRAVVAERCEA